jgi:hypothetical protein
VLKCYCKLINALFLWRDNITQIRAALFSRFLDHTQSHTTDRTPLDEGSVRRQRSLHSTRNRQISMPPAGFFFVLFSCSVFVLYPHLFLVWIVLAIGFCPSCTTHTQNIHPRAGFLFVFSCTLCVLLPYLFLCLRLSCILPFCLHFQHTTQLAMPPAGFDTTIPAGKRPKTYALVREATEIGIRKNNAIKRRALDPRLIPLGHWD